MVNFHMEKNSQSLDVSVFLKRIFSEYDNKGIAYCVERNYQNYPEIITGDIDLVVSSSDFEMAIEISLETAFLCGWKNFVNYKTQQSVHLGFCGDNYPNRYVLVIEFFNGGTWRGLSFLTPKQILNERVRYNDVWRPNSAHEAIITLVHHLLYNGKVFDKYRDNIYNLALRNKEKFKSELGRRFGRRIADEMTYYVDNRKWQDLERLSMKLRINLVIRSLLFTCFSTLKSVLDLFTAGNKKPSGVLINVLDEKDSLDDLLNEILSLADKWHIFIPPNRRLFALSEKNQRLVSRSVVRTLRSGGVAVVKYSRKSDYRRLFLGHEVSNTPYELVIEESLVLLKYKSQYHEIALDSPENMALEFWFTVLNMGVA